MRLLVGVLLILSAGCASERVAGIRFEAKSESVRREVRSLAEFAREGWHLPLRARVFFSDADGSGPLGPAETARQEGLALAQLQEVREAYRHSPFDLFAVDIELREGISKKIELDAQDLRLRVRLPARGSEPISATALLATLGEGYGWKREGRWFDGERTEDLREALRRDLAKLRDLEDQLHHDCQRLELLAGVLGARRQGDAEVVLAPSEAELARAAQFRSIFAINRVLNTFARWRLAAVDPDLSLAREALTATYHARLIHEVYLDWFLSLVVGGRTKVKVWRDDWWHRNPLYTALDSAAPLVSLGDPKRELAAQLPAGSVRTLLSLRLSPSLHSAFEEFDERWLQRSPVPPGELDDELQLTMDRMAGARRLGEEKELDGFTAWKELWDARIKETASVPFYSLVSTVARFLGDTRTSHPEPAVTSAQLTALKQLLKPGDILLVRQDHYLSNAFLPGFWPHALLYLGPADQWTKLPLTDGTTLADDGLAGGALLAYRRSIDGRPARVIEAISEGVVFNSLEHAVQKDYVVVLRPELPETEVAAAIRRALVFLDRPYDFDFDFASDDKLVCTELVYRAYDAGLGFGASREDSAMPGLVEVMGRVTMPANELARFALYMADNPEPRPHAGYPGKKLSVVALLDRKEQRGPAELLFGERARERLAESVSR